MAEGGGREMTELEKAMADIMGGTKELAEGAKDAKKTAAKARRKSRDLENLFADMPSQANWQGLMTLVEGEGEEALQSLFDKIDSDGSKAIDMKELENALKKSSEEQGKNLSDDVIKQEVENMFKDAKIDKAAKIDFAAFKEMMEKAKKGSK